MGKSYKALESKFAKVEWTIMCPIESYSLTKTISIADGNSIKKHDALLIDTKIRYPDELQGYPLQVSFWKTDKTIIADDIDDDHTGVGALSFIGKSEEIDEDWFCIDQPAQEPVFEETLKLLLYSEVAQHIRREIHAKVVGLLNEWDRTGHLCVTEFSVVLSSSENDRQRGPSSYKT